MVSDGLLTSLRDLNAVLASEQTLGVALGRIVETATAAVPGCDSASIAISLEGRPATAAISARIALELDMVQYDTDVGPCLESLRSGKSIRLDLFDEGDPFPHFAVGAHRLGVRSVLSLPARWQDETVGTLNLYSRSTVFDQTAESMGLVLAAQIVIAISRSPEYAAARAVLEQAQRDADDQADVALAAGLLVVNEGCTLEQAHGLLEDAAETDRRPVPDIAKRIIRQHLDTR